MPLPTRTLEQFQEWIWQELPARKLTAGREVVFDVVSVAVQEWPDVVLTESKAGDATELIAMKELEKNVRRHMSLVYGSQAGGAWVVALQILLPLIVDLILKWWRRRKEHRGRLRMWRRKWVNGTES